MQAYILLFTPLLITIVIEWTIFILITREKFWPATGFVVLMNCITWPIVTIFYWYFPAFIYWIEIGVVFAELALIRIYWKYSALKSGLLSFALNASSYFIGTLLLKWIF